MTEAERKNAENLIRTAFANKKKKVVIKSGGRSVLMNLSAQKRSGKVHIGATTDSRGKQIGGHEKKYDHTWIVASPADRSLAGPVFNIAPKGSKGNSKVTG